MSDQINHPSHYGGVDDPYETIKVLRAWLTPAEMRGFLKGNAIKYLSRAGKKGPAEIDHGKAGFYAVELAQRSDADERHPAELACEMAWESNREHHATIAELTAQLEGQKKISQAHGKTIAKLSERALESLTGSLILADTIERIGVAAGPRPDDMDLATHVRNLRGQLDYELEDGYSAAFYKIAEILGIGSQIDRSPKEVFELDILPALTEALSAMKPLQDTGLTKAQIDVLEERRRQVSVEGFGETHDDAGQRGELAAAGACYALAGSPRTYLFGFWPWKDSSWKPRDFRRNLIRAAALIIAEIERLDRKAAKSSAKES